MNNDDSETGENSEGPCTSEISEAAEATPKTELTIKSRHEYEKVYNEFIKWKETNNVNSFSENVLLAYFTELSEKYKSPSLWKLYSILRNTLIARNEVNILKYVKLRNFLKRKAEGYQGKKSRTFTPEEISKFIIAAPDEKYLVVKVALIMGIMGACRTTEMHSMKAEDVQDLGSAFLITIPSTQPRNDRKFTLTGNFYDICKKYVDLRPANIATPYFFLNYQHGKCTIQNIGINKFGSMGKQIATFLRLPNANLYTGHCFRRSSVSLTSNAGVDVMAVLKQYGGWESSSVARVSADDSGTKKANNSLVSKPRTIYPKLPVTSNTHTSSEASTTPLLENDMENYMQWKMMGGSIRLKEGVLPHIFKCQPPGLVWNVNSASESLIGVEPQPKKLKPATTVSGSSASGLTNLNTSGNVAQPTFIVLGSQPSAQLPELLNVCSSSLTSFTENQNETATMYLSQDGKFVGQPDRRTRSNKRKAQEDASSHIEEDEEETASLECTTIDLNSTLCRICFLESNRVKSLLQSDDEETKRFHLMFESLTNTKLEVNETTPSHLCKSCEESLISSYSFRRLCLQSNDNLRNYNAISQSIKREYEENSECLDVSLTDESILIKSEELKIEDEYIDEDTSAKNECGSDIEDTSTENECGPDIEVNDEEKPNLMLETDDFIDSISTSYDIENLVDCYEPDSQNAWNLNSKRTGLKLFVPSCSNVPEIHQDLDEDFNDDSESVSSESEYSPDDSDDESSDCDRLTTTDCEEYGILSSTRLSVAMSDGKMDKNVLDTPESTRVDRNDAVISDIGIETINSSCDPTGKPLPGPTNHNNYVRNPSARVRPTICPICYKDVVSHFTRHLFRYHEREKEIRRLKTLKPKSKERLALVADLRKQGNFILKTEKNITHPVKTSKKPNAEYFTCTYCLGLYTKYLLFRHVKHCKNKPKDTESKGKCLTTSQTYMALVNSKNSDFLKSSRVRNEVFNIMRPDDISETAKNDTLICLYGEALLSKLKGPPIVNVVSNKMREMGRLLIGLRRTTKFDCLFDALKPEYFGNFISVTKEMSGYDEDSKSFRAPSLALHMGSNLKTLCDVANKLIVEKGKIHGIKWDDRETKQAEIRDMKKLIVGHWSNELSSLALKNLRSLVPKNQSEKPLQLPLTSDLQLLNEHLNKLAQEAFSHLQRDIGSKTHYEQLTECVLAKTIVFNRKRVDEDVQYLTIENCSTIINRESFAESDALTEVEKLLCKNLKWGVLVGGDKGSKPIPILFPKEFQKYVILLVEVRQETDTVPKSNPYFFANPGSENRWMVGAETIRKFAENCGAEHPHLLTSTRFRKHIATTLQLLTLDDDEMEEIATFMGHAKENHSEFYRLQRDVNQAWKVAKVLLLMEKGGGEQFRSKRLNEIDVDNEVYCSSESENDEPVMQRVLKYVTQKKRTENQDNITENLIMENHPFSAESFSDNEALSERKKEESCKKKPGSLRSKWSAKERKIVCNYFKDHIKKKMAPKKHECETLLSRHPKVFENKDWVRVKTYIYNEYRRRN